MQKIIIQLIWQHAKIIQQKYQTVILSLDLEKVRVLQFYVMLSFPDITLGLIISGVNVKHFSCSTTFL